MSIITLLNTLENEVDALGLIACTTSIITENRQNILYANTIGDYGTGTTVLQYKYLPNKRDASECNCNSFLQPATKNQCFRHAQPAMV